MSYILKGSTLMQIIAVIKENRVVLTGKTQFDEVGPNGSLLNLGPGASGDSGGGCGEAPPPDTGTFVCGAINGVAQWIATEECDCGIDGGDA